MAKSLAERLHPAHLEVPDTEALKEASAVDLAAAVDEEAPDPREQREFVFQLDFTDGRGRAHRGEFKNKILDIAEQQSVGVFEARLSGMVPYGALSPRMRAVNHAIAHMEFSLVKRPDWAKDLRKLIDEELIFALFTEVAAHESTFRGFGSASEEGEG